MVCDGVEVGGGWIGSVGGWHGNSGGRSESS